MRFNREWTLMDANSKNTLRLAVVLTNNDKNRALMAGLHSFANQYLSTAAGYALVKLCSEETIELRSNLPQRNPNVEIEMQRLKSALKFIEGCEDLKSARQAAQQAGICAG